MLSACNTRYANSSAKTYTGHIKCYARRSTAERSLNVARSTLRVPPAAGQHHLTLQQYDDFELLWLEYRHQLSISKAACLWALQDVQQGVLPGDAHVLKSRAEGVAALGRLRESQVDGLRILNTSRSVLRHDAGDLQAAVTRLLQLLPNVNHTRLILDTAADLDLPPEVLAVQYQEIDMIFTARLGSHISAKPFHYLMQRLRRSGVDDSSSSGDSLQQLTQQQHPRQQAPKLGTFQQVLQTSDGLIQQLQSLVSVLGPELAHAVLQSTPELLDAPVERIQANLLWLQQQLRLSPVATMLLAERCGELLLLPSSQLDQNFRDLTYLLNQLLGWRVQQIGTALYNAPQLLVADSQRCASNWQQVQQLARRRLAWLEELSSAGASLVTAVLCARPVQLTMLQYSADTGDLRGKGLGQVLQMDYVNVITECPGLRSWRAVVPGRWRYFVASKGSSQERSSVAPAVPNTARNDEFVPDNAITSSAVSVSRKVLARDTLGRPVLVAVGNVGKFDRLA